MPIEGVGALFGELLWRALFSPVQADEQAEMWVFQAHNRPLAYQSLLSDWKKKSKVNFTAHGIKRQMRCHNYQSG